MFGQIFLGVFLAMWLIRGVDDFSHPASAYKSLLHWNQEEGSEVFEHPDVACANKFRHC